MCSHLWHCLFQTNNLHQTFFILTTHFFSYIFVCMQNWDVTCDVFIIRGKKRTCIWQNKSINNLDGLRKRISTLFLQYIKTPTFNPEAAKLLKVRYNHFLVCNKQTFFLGERRGHAFGKISQLFRICFQNIHELQIKNYNMQLSCWYADRGRDLQSNFPLNKKGFFSRQPPYLPSSDP
jgi:hypothetical protein